MNDAEQNQELEPLDADTGDHAPVLKDTRDYVEAAVAKVEKAEAAKAEAKDDKVVLRQDDAPRSLSDLEYILSSIYCKIAINSIALLE